MGQKPKVIFVCVHNSCRSQIAEALGKILAADVFDSYSAGTQTKPKINRDAVRLMRQLYGVDMEQTQRSKRLCIHLQRAWLEGKRSSNLCAVRQNMAQYFVGFHYFIEAYLTFFVRNDILRT